MTDPYDALPYDSRPDYLTHPDRLGVAARWAGLAPAPPPSARVLSLGCADASNLLPMAYRMPDCEIVGVERSPVHARRAQVAIDHLGLQNLRVIEGDLMQLDGELGAFDYIIAHGLFSWVADPVRERILAICRDHLTEEGVAHVSYNCLPGWAVRGELREALLAHVPVDAPPRVRLGAAREALDLLEQLLQEPHGPFAELLQLEVAGAKQGSDSSLLHDYLAPINEPFRLDAFEARVRAAGLHVVGEVATRTADGVRGAFLRRALERRGLAAPTIERWADLIRFRQLRRTIIARRPPATPSAAQIFAGVHVLAYLPPAVERPSLEDGVTVRFSSPLGAHVDVARALVKAALLELADRFPSTVPFEALVTKAARRARLEPSDAHPQALASELAVLYETADLDLYLQPLEVIGRLAPGIRLSRLAAFEAERHDWVTSHRHGLVLIDAFDRELFRLLDGSRTPPAIVGAMYQSARSNRLAIRHGDRRVTDPRRLAQLVPKLVGAKVDTIAGHGLLEDPR